MEVFFSSTVSWNISFFIVTESDNWTEHMHILTSDIMYFKVFLTHVEWKSSTDAAI